MKAEAAGPLIAPMALIIACRIGWSVSFSNRAVSRESALVLRVVSVARMAPNRTAGCASCKAPSIVARTLGVPSHSIVLAGGADFTGWVPHQFPFQGGAL